MNGSSPNGSNKQQQSRQLPLSGHGLVLLASLTWHVVETGEEGRKRQRGCTTAPDYSQQNHLSAFMCQNNNELIPLYPQMCEDSIAIICL